MAFRRRDSRNGYSSADAYRSLHNPGDAFNFQEDIAATSPHPSGGHHRGVSSSEEEEENVGSVPPTPFSPDYTQVDERTGLTSDMPARPTSTGDSDHDEVSLSPPRPFFLGNGRQASSDRGSWSSTATLEAASDSDVASTDSVPSRGAPRRPSVGTTVTTARRSSNSGTSAPLIIGGSTKASRAAMRYANAHRDRSASASETAAAVVAPPPPPSVSSADVRARNQQRRRSTLEETASITSDSQGATTTVEATTPSAEPNPFDTPTSSVYVGSSSNVTPPSPSTNTDTSSEVAPAPPKSPTPIQRKTTASKPPSSPTIPYAPQASKPPPSAFPSFPFQSHPGNPDPGTPIPGIPRRSSLESFRNSIPRPTSAGSHSTVNLQQGGVGSVYPIGYAALRGGESVSQVELERPNAAFMHEEEGIREGSPTPPPMNNVPGVYRNSAAAAMGASNGQLAGEPRTAIPRTSSVPSIAMRAPFLSPASRPSSTLWSPPSYPSNPYASNAVYPPGSTPPSLPYLPANSNSNPYLARKIKTPLPSSRLVNKLTNEEKPWVNQKDRRSRASWWLTLACFILGVGASAVVCYLGWTGVKWLKDEDICEVFSDDFNGGSLNTDDWTPDVELGGFGNGEFQMTSKDPSNLFVQNGQLYIVPTLTSDEIGTDSVFDNYRYPLKDCTASGNASACSVTSNKDRGIVVNPVKSARISTKGKHAIQFGKVEVKAKNPRGDWLWPAIWMLPEDDRVYGPWPIGGEIDIMEARGNGPEYTAQGINYVRSSLNYGPLATLQSHIFGWWSNKRASYDGEFHTYTMEWTPDWMRFYVDARLQAMMNVKINGRGGKSFFELGNYPDTAKNGSDADVVVTDVWADMGGSRAAPFDQSFYLIIDLAAGGTSGWFPDGVGGKPWFDGSATAMRDFAKDQPNWSKTWPSDTGDRAFRIDSVKMWKLGKC